MRILCVVLLLLCCFVSAPRVVRRQADKRSKGGLLLLFREGRGTRPQLAFGRSREIKRFGGSSATQGLLSLRFPPLVRDRANKSSVVYQSRPWLLLEENRKTFSKRRRRRRRAWKKGLLVFFSRGGGEGLFRYFHSLGRRLGLGYVTFTDREREREPASPPSKYYGSTFLCVATTEEVWKFYPQELRGVVRGGNG